MTADKATVDAKKNPSRVRIAGERRDAREQIDVESRAIRSGPKTRNSVSRGVGLRQESRWALLRSVDPILAKA